MDDGWTEPAAALGELRELLADGLARARLGKTQLAVRAGLGRTTVQEAFQSGGSVPSAGTVAALARALGLPPGRLLELRRAAAGESGPARGDVQGPGKPVGAWDPHDLEVHPAGPWLGPEGSAAPGRVLSGYVRRAHDHILERAVRDSMEGRSRMVVLVGSSSTGKTRACWEAVQPLAAQGWMLWHPFDPTRAEAALDDLTRVGPRTVVWFNEAQHYLGQPGTGERTAAAVHSLLTDPARGPVLVLGTLWPEYADTYAAPPQSGGPDPHSRVRELLAGRTLTVPDTFDQEALDAAAVLAHGGDRLLADALSRTRTDGRVAQDLAGAPELLRRYEHATPAARAVLQAAMDARRLGAGVDLPQTFLADAAIDYLGDLDHDTLPEDWAQSAFAELARPVHGRQAPLRRTAPRPGHRPPGAPGPVSGSGTHPVFRLADYLDQHGRADRWALCPPASFWHSAHSHLAHPEDLHRLARAARIRHRLQWAHHLHRRAADAGHPAALVHEAELREEAEEQEEAAALLRKAADAGNTLALIRLAELREETGDQDEAEALLRKAADTGNIGALIRLAELREEAGDREEAEALARRAADAGNTLALIRLAELRKEAGDQEEVEGLLRKAADAGDLSILIRLAVIREKAGDQEEAEALLRKAADTGSPSILLTLAVIREKAGDQEEAEALLRKAADTGNIGALGLAAELRERAGDRDGAEALAREATDAGDLNAFTHLAALREETGDREGAEALLRQAADAGNTNALANLMWRMEEAGDREGAEALLRRAADAGNTDALIHLARRMEEAGDHEEAEALLRKAAGAGDALALIRLAVIREKAGDQREAEALAVHAYNAGIRHALAYLAVLREETGNRDGAKTLARKTANVGDTAALIHLARRLNEFGDREGAEALLRQAADAGDTAPTSADNLWPHGLDPDGTPTPPWH
ncbi:hypothetical protein ACWF94_04590 [Streptomyces sp. NPDC055078]